MDTAETAEAGLRFYDVYLETADDSQLRRAEQSFTLAQVRYEDIMLRSANTEQIGPYLTLFALAGYYRTIVYAEMSQRRPVYATTKGIPV